MNLINPDISIYAQDSKKFENLNTKTMENDELRKVSNDFESFFMKQMLDISLKSTKIAGEQAGSDIIQGMYTDALSQQSSGTLGISDMLYRFLSEKDKK